MSVDKKRDTDSTRNGIGIEHTVDFLANNCSFMTYKSSTICSKEEGLDQDGEKWSDKNQILNDHQARPHTSDETGSAIIFL